MRGLHRDPSNDPLRWRRKRWLGPQVLHFRRSQARAYSVVQKAAYSDLDFCDLSTTGSPRWEIVRQYTFWALVDLSAMSLLTLDVWGSKLSEQVQRGGFRSSIVKSKTNTTTPDAEAESEQTIPSYYVCLSLIPLW